MTSVSFSGCAWLLTYQMGVAKYIQGHFDTQRMRFLGASSGSVVALMLATEGDFERGMESALRFARQSKKRFLGPIGTMTHYLTTGLKTHMPKDAYRRVSDRLFVSVTELPFLQNKLLHAGAAKSNEEILQMVLASCYIPLYYEKPILMKGRLYVDGGLTDNCPVLGPETIRVSPKPSWHRERFHIFPKKEPKALHAIFPDLKVMEKLFEQGYQDAKRYFGKKVG